MSLSVSLFLSQSSRLSSFFSLSFFSLRPCPPFPLCPFISLCLSLCPCLYLSLCSCLYLCICFSLLFGISLKLVVNYFLFFRPSFSLSLSGLVSSCFFFTPSLCLIFSSSLSVSLLICISLSFYFPVSLSLCLYVFIFLYPCLCMCSSLFLSLSVYINPGTVCGCPSVCPSRRDLESRTLCRGTSFTSGERFSRRVTQTAFLAYMTRGLREAFGTFRQARRWSLCTQVTLSVYPRHDESCPPLEYRWNILEGHNYRI